MTVRVAKKYGNMFGNVIVSSEGEKQAGLVWWCSVMSVVAAVTSVISLCVG